MKRQTGLFSGTLVYFGFNLLNYFFRLLISVIIARTLGTDGKGIYTIVVLTGTFLTRLAGLGLPEAVVYLGAAKRFSGKAIFSFGLAASAIGALVGDLVFAALFWLLLRGSFLAGVTARQVVLLCAFLFFNLLVLILNSLLVSEQKILAANLVEGLRNFTNLVFQAAAFFLHTGVDGALAAWLGGTLCAAALALYLTREHWSLQFRRLGPISGEALRYGMKTYIAGLTTFANYRLDSYLINAMAGAGQVGLYSTGVSLAELTGYLPNSISAVLFPKVPTLDPQTARKVTARICRQIVLVMLPFSVFYAWLGALLIPLIYTERFQPSVAPFLWLLPGMLALAVSKVLTADFAGRGKPQYATYASGLTLFVTIALDLLLIPRYGIIGAAGASSLAYSVAAGLLVYYFNADTATPVSHLLIPQKEDFVFLWQQAGRLAARFKRGVS